MASALVVGLAIAAAQSCAVDEEPSGGFAGGTTTSDAPPEHDGGIDWQGGLGRDAGPKPGFKCPPTDPAVCNPGAQTPCYDGPPGTEGIGSCAAGARFCNVEGTAYGPCLGQDLPHADDCSKPTTWVCDGQPADCTKVVEAEVLLGKVVVGLASDGAGGLVRAYFEVGGWFGIERLLDGQVVWSNEFQVAGVELSSLAGMTVDDTGSTIVAISSEGSIDLDGELVPAPAVVLFKLDTGGALVWTRALASADSVSLGGVAAGPAGDIWVVGSWTGVFDFGAGSVQAEERDGFLLRLDADGTTVWSTILGSPDDEALGAVTVAADGTSYVGGRAQTSGKCNHSAVLLASYDPTGALRWKKTPWSQQASGAASAFALDGVGYVYVSGRINTDPLNALDLGGGPLDGTMFLAKLDKDGNHIWSTGVMDVPHGPAMGGHVAVDASRVVWANQDESSVHIRTFDIDGHFFWERFVEVDPPPLPPPDDGIQTIPGWGMYGFAMLTDRRIAISGEFVGTIDFGEGPVNGNGGYFAVFDP